MKRNIKGFILLTLVMTLLMTTALAAGVKDTIEVAFNSINLTVNNEKVNAENIVYDETTYVPLRAVAEMLGKEVGWNQETNTASINDKEVGKQDQNKEENLGPGPESKKTIEVVYNSINITVNNKKVNTDNLLYNETTYVPLRAVSELLDKEVNWNQETNTASINDGRPLKVHYIDVAQGDSIFIQLPNNQTMLIDGGTKSKGETVLNYLKEEKVQRIDYLVGTHPHEDHIGGLIEVVNQYDIGEIYMPDIVHTTKTFENLLLAIKSKGYKMNKAIAGHMILDEESLSLKILAPEENYQSSNLNNYSVVIKLDYKDNSFIFTGDAEKASEETMLTKPYDLKADVLKAGHHGSNTSTTDGFLDKVNPKYVVISAGTNNRYNHPDQDILDKLKARGIEVFRTDLDGNIVAESDGKNITFIKKQEVD